MKKIIAMLGLFAVLSCSEVEKEEFTLVYYDSCEPHLAKLGEMFARSEIEYQFEVVEPSEHFIDGSYFNKLLKVEAVGDRDRMLGYINNFGFKCGPTAVIELLDDEIISPNEINEIIEKGNVKAASTPDVRIINGKLHILFNKAL
ncbi:hypothetical protein G8764_22060 [Pseudomaricurvus alcaniphilus]|uniref:hypothetical protein n=1 Tax=Pseudomaricurvus alcaniphilus TaxID=1166482 RepID=UPI00140A6E62|nr:hypothetical protein [Pseudomaricurvus alcaniphilus]NHN39991.1 hypothetical protein [Pseudomaricurvus alcaniphilus]